MSAGEQFSGNSEIESKINRPAVDAGISDEPDDELDDLDDMEFMLDEIENRIAPLA